MNEKAKPILRWPGGKGRLVKKIVGMIQPHVCYCEPCIGGGAVFFAKERSPVEVVNDINGDLVALLLNAQRHLPELLRQIETCFSSRQLFHLIRQQPGLTELERAARFLLRNRTSFGGNMNSFAVSKTRGGGSAFDRSMVSKLVERAHERLDRVVIENISYERCFANYDSRDTFFFIDPPYLNAKIKAYDGWDESQLRTFRRHLGKLKGKWIVTLDDSPFNRELFSDFNLEAVSSRNQSTNISRHEQTFGELIITPQKAKI